MANRRNADSDGAGTISWSKIAKDENRAKCDDYFDGNGSIMMLDKDTYKDALKDKEVILVMYHDPCNQNCQVSKNHFIFAADSVERENSAFAAVNCTTQPKLCDSEKVTTVPLFKLFSTGALVNTIPEYHNFTFKKMRDFVEKCPVKQNPDKEKEEKKCEGGEKGAPCTEATK